MGIAQRIRRVRGARVLVTMLVVGVACLVAGAVCHKWVKQPYLVGETIVDLNGVMVPASERRCSGKTTFWVCPSAFMHGTDRDLSIRLHRKVVRVDTWVEVPLRSHIHTIALVSYVTAYGVEGQLPARDIEPDVRRAAINCVWSELHAWNRDKERSPAQSDPLVFDSEQSMQTEWIPMGVAAVTLLPLGSLLVIPPAVVLPVMMLRRLSGVRQRRGQAVAVDGMD